MNTIMRIVLALMLTVFLGGMAIAADNAWLGFYGPSISPSGGPAESQMSSGTADHSIALTGFSGPAISPSNSSEGVALKRPATSGTSLCAADHSNAVMERAFSGPAISPSNSAIG